ncbi:MAG: hypothetical protein J7513_04915, partial [Solirubrobacteraceae bacterium]|nr:hypothetical protein [Solirubrobacteraceae bacterium]
MTAAVLLTAVACVAAAAAILDLVRALPAGELRRRRRRGVGPVTDVEWRGRWAATRNGDPAVERLLDAAGRHRGVATAAELADRQRTAGLLAAAWTAALLAALAGPTVAALAVVPAGIAGRRVPHMLLVRLARARATT